MLNMNLSALVAALDEQTRSALEEAAALCVSRGGHEVGVEDFVEKLIECPDVLDILAQFGIAVDAVKGQLLKRPQGKGGASGRPVFSPLLIELLQEAWLLASLELKREAVGGHALVLAMLLNPVRYSVMGFYRELGKIPADELKRLLEGLSPGGSGGGAAALPAAAGDSHLKKYAVDFMEEARRGAIDPVFARGPELRQIIDILTRRRKNNPILVGDPGVGKTAVVEGLALRIVEGNVPDALAGVRVIGLDMGRLQAGASVKGEFEKRLKGIIDEVKASPTPIVLFIDEAHTLVGAGNTAGGGDGANLLKPALARGELRTIAATTWSEYKKYFEKDAALARRFQLVKLDEPSLAETVTILRGIVPHYEKMHQVYIRDDAVLQTAELSTRYISGRRQPDKAIDVLDTACARVRVSLGARPDRLERREEELAAIKRELAALERDGCQGLSAEKNAVNAARYAVLQGETAAVEERIKYLKERWEREKALVKEILSLRTGQDVAPQAAAEGAPLADGAGDNDASAQGLEAQARRDRDIIRLRAELRAAQGDDPLVFFEVTPRLASSIVAEWTGIPLEKINEDAAGKLARLGERLRARIKGQDFALQSLEKAVLTSRTGMNNPGSPTAIFLLVGPSGTGKTETALAVADELYGGERSIISINMSEFQEKHTISRLIGSPPGYVGYGEGGRLTEAVRRQPYSVVLFDEVEKAHPEVLNLFYQMFDKGVLADGEGREIDFRNTMIFLTSNLGSDIVAALCEDGEVTDPALMREALRPVLTQFFKPALLGRMTVIPYTVINPETMRELVTLKLGRVAERLMARHRIRLGWNEDVTESIAASCTAVDTGARNIDHIINATLLPGIASVLLGSLSDSAKITSLHLGLDAAGGSFTYQCAGESRA